MEFCETKQMVIMGHTRNAYRNVVRNLLGISQLVKAKRRSEDNIRMHFMRTNCDGARWTGLTEVRVQWQAPLLALLNFCGSAVTASVYSLRLPLRAGSHFY
jgi:hypothetical protein